MGTSPGQGRGYPLIISSVVSRLMNAAITSHAVTVLIFETTPQMFDLFVSIQPLGIMIL
jgi:hypothetical protein